MLTLSTIDFSGVGVEFIFVTFKVVLGKFVLSVCLGNVLVFMGNFENYWVSLGKNFYFEVAEGKLELDVFNLWVILKIIR